MESPRYTPILFQPVQHTPIVRLCRKTCAGQWLLTGLSKLWNRRARRVATVLNASIASILFGDWPVQAVAIVAIIITIIWWACVSEEPCLCQ